MSLHPHEAERFVQDLQDAIEDVSSFWIPSDELWRVLDRMADEGHATLPDRTIRSGDPLDCPACGYDPMAPHNGKGDCAIDRTSGCRDCGCPDRSDDHLREEWTCGCQCHTDRTDGRLSP